MKDDAENLPHPPSLDAGPVLEDLDDAGFLKERPTQEVPLETEKHYEGLEWVANPPLEKTSLVYSVPVRGEWNNGQVARLLQGMLAQRVAQGQAFEVNLVANLGGLSDVVKGEEEKVLKKRGETEEVVRFMRHIVGVQRLAREMNQIRSRAKKKEKEQELEEHILSVPDPLLQDLLRQAAAQAEQVSVALVDARKVNVDDISLTRTLGMDALQARFPNNDQIAVSLFDVDTVPLDNHTVQQLQALYAADSRLTYVFSSMSDQAKGGNRLLASDTTMTRHIRYNTDWGHGSPQISFRLHAYGILNRIRNFNIIGDEDRDTAVRLAYHFNSLQDGLLFESSKIAGLDSSTRVLTADRLDGFIDGRGERRGGSPENLLKNIERIWSWRRTLREKMKTLPEEERAVAFRVLEEARGTELRREKVQQRMNKTVVRSLLRAHRDGWIKMDGQEEIHVDEEKLLRLPGGKALAHFLRMNRPLVMDVLQSPDDLQCLSYYAGLTETFPEQVKELSSLQHAFREYLGDVKDLSTSPEVHVVYLEETDPDPRRTKEDAAEDRRPIASKLSFWHGMTAEMLALAYVDRALFQSAAFAQYQEHTTHWDKRKRQETGRARFLGADAEQVFATRIQEMTQLHGEQVRMEENHSEHPLVKFLSGFLPIGALLDRLMNR